MPNVDGFVVVEALQEREEWQSIPVVVMTALDLTREDQERLKGCTSKVLQKGKYDRRDLIALIRQKTNSDAVFPE